MYVKINGNLYPAIIEGRISDYEWDNRESKSITMEGEYTLVDNLFQNDVPWSIVEEIQVPVLENRVAPVSDEEGNNETDRPSLLLDEEGNPKYTSQYQEYDNSEFCIRGDLTVHVDGTCTVKMGKTTDLEDAYEMLYGGM